MPTVFAVSAPGVSVGTTIILEGAPAPPEPAISLNFHPELFATLTGVLARTTSVVHAGMDRQGDVAKIVVAIISDDSAHGGTPRHVIVGEADFQTDEPHFQQFMREFESNKMFLIRLGLLSPDQPLILSEWGIHLPDFDPNFRTIFLGYFL